MRTALVAGGREGRFCAPELPVPHEPGETMQIESPWRHGDRWRPRCVVGAVGVAATAGIAMVDAEAIWELPVTGRFLGP